VLNQYGFGGYLIWSDIKPFIDSRAEIFRDEGLGQYADLADGDAKTLDRVLSSGNIGWTIFAPEERAPRRPARRQAWLARGSMPTGSPSFMCASRGRRPSRP